VQSSNEIVIVDSCLFGYLTWTLFPYGVPNPIIKEYVKAVERIIAPLHPFLIYLYQTDLGAALAKICNRRGVEKEHNFVRAATQSIYGKSKGLVGFAGMVAYWKSRDRGTSRLFHSIRIWQTDRRWSPSSMDSINAHS
jgi:hypothetical protein